MTPGDDAWRSSTWQRDAVLTALRDVSRFRSAQDIHLHLRTGGIAVGLTTVYRTLARLAAEGRVDTVRADSGEVLYRLCSSNQHHYLVCRVCGMAVNVDASMVARWAIHIASQHGYRESAPTLTLFGVCPQCGR